MRSIKSTAVMPDEQELTPEEIDSVFAMYPMCKTSVPGKTKGSKGFITTEDYLRCIDFDNHEVYTNNEFFKQDEIKLILNQLQYITDAHVYGACYACDNNPFSSTKLTDWKIVRESYVIRVRHKYNPYSYQLDQYNGNVHLFIDGSFRTIGKQAAVMQYLLRHYYALPLYFHPKHWANGKTLHQIGLATPNFGPLKSILSVIFEKDESLIKEWFVNKRLEEVQLYNYKVYNEVLESLCKEHNLSLYNFL